MRMAEAKAKFEEYSFIEGGLFRKVQLKLGIENNQGFLALAGICFAWIPLVILTLLDRTFYSGAEIPFLKDYAIHARLLIGVPMLILIRDTISVKTGAVTQYVSRALLKDEEQQKMLTRTLPFMRKLACSSFTELVIVLLVVGSVLGLIQTGAYGGIQSEHTNWMYIGNHADHHMSRAGQWASYISIPFFQFLLLQWLWRYIVWILMLRNFAKAEIDLLPTHADRSGGLGIIILAQKSFSFVFVVGSLVMAGQLITHFMDAPDLIKVIQAVVIGYLILCLLLLLAPMLFFTAKLVRTKQKGLFRLSQLSTELSQKFETDWLNEIPIEKRIEDTEIDPSMVYDYNSMYDVLQQLRVVPITRNDIISIAVSLVVPFLPILFVYYSAKEVLEKIIGLIL